MTPIDEKRFHATIREVIRALAITMADVQARVPLQIIHGPRGRQGWIDALQVARQSYQPILDNLDQASDQKLLDMLRDLKGPVH